MDLNSNNCRASDPPGTGCPVKFANEAFTFLTLYVPDLPYCLPFLTSHFSIFTFFSLFLEATSLLFYQKEKYLSRPPSEKNSAYHQPIGHNGAAHDNGVAHDNPNDAMATAA